ncbi:MAG: tetratricopeptide (TPR) repeat protein [Candidatus Azotimanducaceae bacterium]|jgi:tetratricopeptide (TPR) repeat protein
MSLLLEALKKAALQKRDSGQEDREYASSNTVEDVTENANLNDAVSSEIDTEQKKNARDKWLEKHENMPAEEPLGKDDVGIAQTSEFEPVEENIDDVGTAELEENDVDLAVGNMNFEADDTEELEDTELSVLGDDDKHQDSLDIDELEILDIHEEFGEDVDLESELEKSIEIAQEGSEDELELEVNLDEKRAQNRSAMAELMAKSQHVVSKARRRELYLYIFFFLTASVSIGAWYYYLSLNDYSLQIPQLSSSEAAQIEKHSQANREVTPVVLPGADVIELLAPPLNSELVTSLQEGASFSDKETMSISSSLGNDVAQGNSTLKSTKRIVSPNLVADTGSLGQSSDYILTRKISSRITGPSKLSIEVNDLVKRGFNAYQLGDFELARREYEKALALAPLDRDALLGGAALASVEGRWQDAIRLYQARLAEVPTDEFARAGLLSLASLDSEDPSLKRDINLMLGEFPDAAHLHFIKGAIHAASREWGAAQKAFFDAYYLDRFNADYAYNLAVSMDHLNQVLEAKSYYQLALRLNQTQPANFDPTVLKERVKMLEGANK